MNQGISTEAAIGAIKGSPPVIVATAALSGITLQQWVLIATLIYTGLLIIQKLWTMARGLWDKADG